MPGGVNDIDAIVLPADRCVFGEDGDSPFLFLIVGVHDPLGARRFAVQGARLLQQAVHQRGLAMVYVGNNGDVSQLAEHGTRVSGVMGWAARSLAEGTAAKVCNITAAGRAPIYPKDSPKRAILVQLAHHLRTICTNIVPRTAVKASFLAQLVEKNVNYFNGLHFL